MNEQKVDFVHLHVHTAFSLLDGSCRISNLIDRTKELGMSAIAITDHGCMYGVIDFYKEAKAKGIKPIIGCEVYVASQGRFHKTNGREGEAYNHLVLLAENQLGYRNLVELVTRGYTEGFYYKPRIDRELLEKYHEGLIGLSACLAGEIPAHLLRGNADAAWDLTREYLRIFGKNNFFIELQDHGMPEEQEVNNKLVTIAKELGIGLVATNDTHYVRQEDAESHDVLLCIQTARTVEDEQRMRFPGRDFYLKSPMEMQNLFIQYPEALTNTCEIAKRCQVDFEFGHLHLPVFPVPEEETADSYLRRLCEEKLLERYPEKAPGTRQRLDYELSVIQSMQYSGYFLIVWDFIRFAREHAIPVGPGRGSAAGSIVAYLLGITAIDPLKYGLLFERFLNPERVTMPDIDIDFCYEQRNQIIDYVSQRYGADKVAQIITFGTLAAKAAVRDVGRALNLSYSEVDRIAKLIPQELGITLNKALDKVIELRELYQNDMNVKRLLDIAISLEGLPRHASTHAAGVVIAKEPLSHYLPLQNSAEGFLTTQYDKDRIEELGLLKMDLLGLRTLTVIGDCLKLIYKNRKIHVDIEIIPQDDNLTCQMLSAGDTVGVFQMESSGMTHLVRDLRPESFEDLIPLVALYRPGPLGSGMVEDFIRGRHGKKEIVYLHPLLEPILRDTFGVILYQEQVMQIASAMAGFSLGQADMLRRAMGKKKHEVLMAQKDQFLAGSAEKGIQPEIAQKVFDLMVHFADYGFNKSHSAAYALVAYQTAWLKANYRPEFMAALLTSVMGDSAKVGGYIEACRHAGISTLPPHINLSGASFTVDGDSIRCGLACVKNAGLGAIQSIIAEREKEGDYLSLVDFCARVDMRVVNKRVLESLVECGAFDVFGKSRAQLLAVLDHAVQLAVRKNKDRQSGQMGLFGEQEECGEDLVYPQVPELDKRSILSMEKELLGFYITGHPLDEYRDKLEDLTAMENLSELQFKDGMTITVGGLITGIKRMNTRRGELMGILIVEDFTASLEIVLFPQIFQKVQHHIGPEATVRITGRLSKSEDQIKIIASRMVPLSEEISHREEELHLTIVAAKEHADTMQSVTVLLGKNKGTTPVYLHIASSGRTIKTASQYWVQKNDNLIQELRMVLGEQAVR